MKERPILFSGEMVRAILDGTKTQTRRVVKMPAAVQFEPEQGDTPADLNDLQEMAWFDDHEAGPGFYAWLSEYPEEGSMPVRCPYGEPGERLWVRETFAPAWCGDWVYAADYSKERLAEKDARGFWKPSIHMPRQASRLTLEVTAVRVERLQDISEADARAEGCPAQAPGLPRHWYAQLWDRINGAGAWDANPWVWVVEFHKVEGGAA